MRFPCRFGDDGQLGMRLRIETENKLQLAMRRLWTSLLVSALVILMPSGIWATTTSGATTRNVNTTDGIVVLGAAPGTNGADWETDEGFQGYQSMAGSVDWYLTWDDNNVYIGRIGGNNAEGSVVYLRAEYPGAVYNNRGQDYDQLNPDVSPMGGVNFAAYFKDSYHEYRTSNGSWSPATVNTLNPRYTTQGNGSNFEVTIPWSAITAGNGRPTNIRLVLYQVVPTGIPCVQEFVYAESPWGTGNTNDGPSVGVNDGQPISLRQPGGCNVGDSTAWRWWGCYPVIGGVGSNGWRALAPNAGPDDSICQTATSYFLTGNAPPGQATGTWSVFAQPPGSGPVNFIFDTIPNPIVQSLDSIGTYTFIWDINYGGCPSTPDTVVITRVANSSTAGTMNDTILSCNSDSVLLQGNAPGNGTGLWSVTGGSGVIANPTDSVTAATGLSPGFNLFQYAVSNGVCPTTTAVVSVYSPISVFADAGPEIQLCLGSITTLAANDPSLIQSSAVGGWVQISGPSNVVFNNPVQNNTNASNLQQGVYQLLWTVFNANCPVETDTVLITNYEAATADAGGDQAICLGDPLTLQGNDIASLGASGSAAWSQLAGPTNALFANPTQYNTAVANLAAGSYVFSWRVNNGTCPSDSDAIAVTVVDLQNNGILNSILPDSGASNGTIIVAQPINGNNPYLYSIDGLNFGGSATFAGLSSGSYTFYMMDANGCSDSLSFELLFVPPIDTLPAADTIKVPTGFSPNADGTNDTWEIPGIDHFPNAQIEVFNIWGGLVFQSAGVYRPWNGQRNGQDLPSANYYFVIDLKTEGQPLYKGSLTILR